MALMLSDRDEISSVLMGDPRRTVAVRASAVPTLGGQADDTGTLSPLMDVALRGSSSELSSMLQAGQDVNAVATSVGITALMCGAHDPAKTALLISAGANVNAAAKTGHTALLIAADNDGAAESVKLLLEHGADPDAHTSQPARMNTPLIRAALRGDRVVVALLLEHAATLNDHPTGSSALVAAVNHADSALVAFLLDRGAKLGSQPPAGTGAGAGATPLMLAADRGAAELVTLLLGRGANVNARDSRGMTPFIYAAGAIDRGTTVVVEALIAAGADIGARTAAGDTALNLAKRYGKASRCAIAQRDGCSGREMRP